MSSREALAGSALAATPAGLLTDLDGTLAPIIDDPAAVRPVPGAAEALAALAGRLAVVGVVTGRAAAEARRIVGLDDLLVVGNHGLEWLAPGAAAAEPTPAATVLSEAVERASRAVPAVPGVIVERKGLSATVHVRGAADPEAARGQVREALAAASVPGVEIRPGRMSLELRPRGAGDKGSALRAVVGRYRLRGLLVLGDDVTDLDMFRAAADLRREGRLRAAILAVRGGREVPSEVAAAADDVVASPEALVDLLTRLAASTGR